MQLVEVLNRWGHADFDGILGCEFCGSHQYMPGGYADTRFYEGVIPAIKCLACDKRTCAELKEGINDPEHHSGELVELKEVLVRRWVKKNANI